jgi:hypothetical protein
MNLNIEEIKFSKPKKHGEHLICKVKYPNESGEFGDFIIQLPKMKVDNDFLQSDKEISKNVTLEFLKNKSKYNKEIYDFLSNLDLCIINFIHKNSLEWFGKEIPVESLNKMYNKFIKAPKDSNSNCTMNFSLKKNNLVLIDNRKNELELSSIKKDSLVECITQLKYIIFSKDTCFTLWELCNIKMYKKINKVPKFGFIDDSPENVDHDSDLELEVDDDYSFF